MVILYDWSSTCFLLMSHIWISFGLLHVFVLVGYLTKHFFKEKIQENSFNEEFRELVEKRISLTRKKLENQNLQKLLKKRIKITRSILNIDNITQ